MKPTRLSTQLGLAVTAMSAVLVMLMAAFAYGCISHQLDLRAQTGLNKKLGQIEHNLAESSLSVADIVLLPNNLREQIIESDDFCLTIYDAASPAKRLLHLGNDEMPEQHLAQPGSLPKDGTTDFRTSTSAQGDELLTASRSIRLKNGQHLLLLLTQDRKSDATLLNDYVTTTLIALPLILLLVGGCAWWIVRRGLRPLRSLRRVAERISARDLSHRMHVAGLPEELLDVAHAVNFMLQRLDGDVRQLTQFSDDLAHELRSPMNNLMGKAQVTLSRPRPPEVYKKVLESCTEELERLSLMVSQMLFLASVGQPSVPLALSEIDLGEEAAKVAELFASSAEDKNLQVHLRGSAHVRGDRLMIQRAISNLLSNAIRHGAPGSTITINLDSRAEAITLAVSNEGEGIEAEHLPRLFDRFYRVHASRSRQQGGTGLGLAIVRSIMSVHNGQVLAQSQRGQTTTFSLLFPAIKGI